MACDGRGAKRPLGERCRGHPCRLCGGGGSDDARRDAAEWGQRAHSEPRWPATSAVAVSIALYFALPDRLISGLGPRWLIPALEFVLGASLLIANPHLTLESRRLRPVAIVLIAFVNLANVVSLGELVHELLAVNVHNAPGGRTLIYASVPVWVTNVIVFALWYWELDRGGPVARLELHRRQPDFLFPQMTAPDATRRGMVAGVHRLPLHVVHQRHRLQPHRHHAAHAVGEDALHGPVVGVTVDRRPRGVACREHPQLIELIDRPQIEAAIFDMDGLLVDSEPIWHDVEIDVFGRHGVALTVERCLETKGMYLGDAVEHWYVAPPLDRGDPCRGGGRDRRRHGPSNLDAAVELKPGALARPRLLPRPAARCWPWRRRRRDGSSTPPWTGSVWARASPWCTRVRTRRWASPIPPSSSPRPGSSGWRRTACVVFEDSAAGVLAAKGAGMACVAVPEADPTAASGIAGAGGGGETLSRCSSGAPTWC